MNTITIPTAKKYEADKDFIKFLSQFYPNGATIKRILEDENCALEYVYWIDNYFPKDDEDNYWIRKRLKIEESDVVKNSYDCRGSFGVFGSNAVSNSQMIYTSAIIENSKKIHIGRNISNSEECERSNSIVDSKSIHDSNNIFRCTEVGQSSFCYDSFGISKSNIVGDSYLIRKSSNVKNCIFCAESKDLENCIGCYDLQGQKNHIFNAPAAPELVELVRNMFLHLDAYKNYRVAEPWMDGKPYGGKVWEDYRKSYRLLGKDFFYWLKQCPFYNDDIVYNITKL